MHPLFKTLLTIICLVILTSPVLANIAEPSSEIQDLPRDSQLVSTITSVVLWLMVYAFALSVLFLVVAGIIYVVSAGNPDTIKQAKDILTYAITGLVISLVGYFLVVAISGILFGDIVGGVFGIFG